MSANRSRGYRMTIAAILCGQSLLLVASGPARGADQFEPKAARLLDKYVEVTGGEGAYDAIKTRVIQGELAGPARGIAGQMRTYFGQAGRFYSAIDTVAGLHRRGCNGNTVWKIEPFYERVEADLKNLKPVYRPRVARGLERVLVLRDGTLDRFGHWRLLAEKVAYVGEEEVAGKSCAKVSLTYKPIDPEVKEEPVLIYLDLATGLIVQYATAISRPEGFVNVTAVLDNYKKVDDVLIPHKMTLKTDNVEQYTVRVIRVENNVVIPAQRFVLPREIQKLLVTGQ